MSPLAVLMTELRYALNRLDQIETRAALALGIHSLPADDLPPGLGAQIVDRVAFQLARIAEESI